MVSRTNNGRSCLRRTRRWFIPAVLLLFPTAQSAFAAPEYAAPRYQITKFPDPPAVYANMPFVGVTPSPVGGIGQIALNAYYRNLAYPNNQGWFDTPTAMTFHDGQYTFLPIPVSGADSSWVTAVSTNGIVAGTISQSLSTTSSLPILWKNGIPTTLPLGPFTAGAPTSVNNLGQAAGSLTADLISNQGHATWWDQNGTLHDLGTFDGTSASVRSINDHGTMLIEVLSDTGVHSFVLDQGSTTPLPFKYVTYGMNQSGHVLAESENSVQFWNGTSTQTISPLAPGFNPLRASLNDNDEAVIQWSKTKDDMSTIQQPVYWDGTTSYDLNTLLDPNSGWTIITADALADDGTIIGEGTYDGQFVPFLLTPLATTTSPAPEPASLALLALGSLALLRRR